jgi:PAS domain S-box-containing protein
MSTVTLPDGTSGAARVKEASFAKRLFAFSGFCLVAGLALSIWLCLTANNSALFPGEDSLAAVFKMAGPLALAVVLAISTGIAGFKSLQSGWRRRLAEQDEDYRKTLTSTRMQLADVQNMTEMMQRLEDEKTELAHAKAQLQAELDTLKRSQKNLLWRRQELESSKTVLELHVQERSEEVQRLQRQYELILNSAGEGICGLDLRGCATFVNPAAARMTGWTTEELIGKSEEQIFGTVEAPQKDSSSKVPEERVFRRKNGSLFPVECVKTPLDENGRVVGAVLIFKDITERKRVEEAVEKRSAELAQSNAELEQFAFVASHDLQEPLRKIQAFGDRLKTRLDGALGPEPRDYLERMQNASARMRTLINDLLSFSRVIRRTEPFVPVDLNQVAKGVMGDLEVRIEKSSARIELGELPVVEGDMTQMHQLLLNLLGNALKFQPPGGQPVVKITSRTYTTLSGQELCEIQFTDNGIGFEEKYLDKIFAVFQRLHGRNEYEGTGVGLAVCRRITDRHHGTISAKSELGKGATFVVILPVRQDKTDAAANRPETDTAVARRAAAPRPATPSPAEVAATN